MAVTADLSDGLQELLYKSVNNTYEIFQVLFASSGITLPPVGDIVTQYTETNTDTSITGTAAIWEDAGDTGRAISRAKPLPIRISDVKSYSAAPSNFTPGIVDATVFTLAAGDVGYIHNLDDKPLAVKRGSGASTTSFSFILSAGAIGNDGKGASIVIDDYIGTVSVAAMTGAPSYIAYKQTT